MDKDSSTDAGEPALFAGAAWFDPIEAGLRGRIRGFIEGKRQPSYAACRFAPKFQGSSSARRPAGCPRARRSRMAAM